MANSGGIIQVSGELQDALSGKQYAQRIKVEGEGREINEPDGLRRHIVKDTRERTNDKWV